MPKKKRTRKEKDKEEKLDLCDGKLPERPKKQLTLRTICGGGLTLTQSTMERTAYPNSQKVVI